MIEKHDRRTHGVHRRRAPTRLERSITKIACGREFVENRCPVAEDYEMIENHAGRTDDVDRRLVASDDTRATVTQLEGDLLRRGRRVNRKRRRAKMKRRGIKHVELWRVPDK